MVENGLELDFGKFWAKLKGLVPGPRKRVPETSKEELELDIGAVWAFIARHRVVLLIIAAIVLAIFLRMQSSRLAFTDDWAMQSVENYFKTQLRMQISARYPTLPESNRASLVEEEWLKFAKVNKAMIVEQAARLSQQFKANWQDEAGFPYMPDIDPYTYLRYARNLLERGDYADERREGRAIDNHMIAPLGSEIEANLHPYTLAAIYKLAAVVRPGITLMQAAGYFPVIFVALSIIPAFFIGRKLGGNLGGFLAAALLAAAPALLGRTLWGHADTDTYNVFFPLFIVWLLLESIEAKEARKKLGLAAGAGTMTGLYSFSWGGWWYIFDFALGMLGLLLVWQLVRHARAGLAAILRQEDIKGSLLVIASYILLTGLFVSIIKGFMAFVRAPIEPIAFSVLKAAAHPTLWPNVYTTVAELNPAPLSAIIASLGGSLMAALLLFGIITAFTKRDAKGALNPSYGLLLTLWTLGIIYASTKGVRFTMMLVPPLALAFGSGLAWTYNKVVNFFEKGLDVKRVIVGPLFILLYLFIIYKFAAAPAYAMAIRDVPIINDAWFAALEKIRQQSEPDAIINSWWDFGHHFKYFADRAVTFDGASQNTPMAHWIGLVLLTENEELAVGLLRMLDCGSNSAFEELDGVLNDSPTTVALLKEIVPMDRADAAARLRAADLSEGQIEAVLARTHCSPPEDYFITSEDMVAKSGVWAHFGSWDFVRAWLWLNSRKLALDSALEWLARHNIGKEQGTRLYYEARGLASEEQANAWISPWPSYLGRARCEQLNQSISCENGVQINLSTLDVSVPTQQGAFKPASLIYLSEGGQLRERTFNSTFPYSVLLAPKRSGLESVLAPPELARSMFSRLFFFEGAGLNHFKLFDYQRDITGTEIYVWKVEWD